jgi:hypothetical protein
MTQKTNIMKTNKFCCRKIQLSEFQIAVVANIVLIMGIAFGSKGNSATRLSVDGKTEIAFNRKWAEEAFSARIRGNLSDRMNPGIPFSFVYGGKNSTDFLDGWKKQVKDEKIDATKCRHTLTLTDPVTGLEVRAVATIYTNTAGVDWTLYFTNNGTMDSPVIEQVNALDVTIKLGENQNSPVLHRIKGGGGGVDDWMPFDEILNAGQKKEFAPTGGRSSFGNTPWFNLQWNGGGVITAIGWTGQWKALVENSSGTGRIQAGMQNLHLKLLPGETIRSPRIMQLYWFGNDEIRAYNLFRQTMFAHILPKVDGKPISPPIVHLSTAFYEMDKGTEANVLSHLSAIKGLGFEYFWMDAYYGKDDFPTVGNYVFPLLRGFNLKRFPLGIKPIGEAVRKADMKFLMWFEYERICPGTLIAKEHPEWVVLPPDGGWGMFNLAIPEAREYICEIRESFPDFATAAHERSIWFSYNIMRQSLPFNHAGALIALLRVAGKRARKMPRIRCAIGVGLVMSIAMVAATNAPPQEFPPRIPLVQRSATQSPGQLPSSISATKVLVQTAGKNSSSDPSATASQTTRIGANNRWLVTFTFNPSLAIPKQVSLAGDFINWN